MLTYNIVVAPEEKPRHVAGSVAHKAYIFDKHFKAWCQNVNAHSMGEDVKVKGDKGTIIDVVIDFDLIEWDGLKPKFLEVWLYGAQTTQLFHPSELK